MLSLVYFVNTCLCQELNYSPFVYHRKNILFYSGSCLYILKYEMLFWEAESKFWLRESYKASIFCSLIITFAQLFPNVHGDWGCNCPLVIEITSYLITNFNVRQPNLQAVRLDWSASVLWLVPVISARHRWPKPTLWSRSPF